MATEVRFRRGTTAQHASFIGAPAEITVDTDKKTVVVHDGVTAGGFPLASDSTAFKFTDTLATLKDTPLSYERVYVKAHSTEGDGGHGVFRSVTGAAAGTYVDNNGTIIVPTGGDGSSAWVREFTGALNVKWFGAKGDGVSDDTSAIQSALDSVENGGSVYFPKNGGGYPGPSYVITSGLVLSKNDVTIYTDPRPEYSEGIKTNNAITILTVAAFGLKVVNMAFKGNGSTTTFGTANGIVIDRRSLGDAETYSNLDCDIRDCSFSYLNDAIIGYGRNVFVFDNIFSICKRGVVGNLHTYSGGTVSSFRGWRINGNRFHSIGYPYISPSSTVTVPSLGSLDSWCIDMPQTSGATSHLEIMDNNGDFCGGGFYKGYLGGAKISNNIWHRSISIFVFADITDSDNQATCSTHLQEITNNQLNNRNTVSNTTRGYQLDYYSFYIRNVSNLKISNNSANNSWYDLLNVSRCDRLIVSNNSFINSNNAYAQDATARPGITIVSSINCFFSGNYIRSLLGGSVYSNGVATSNVSGIKVRDNTVENAINAYGIAASDLSNAFNEGLSWVLPSGSNGYVISGRGYRRLFNGMVEIDMQLTGGADNAEAFVLPLGYRPVSSITLPSASVWVSKDAYIFISSNGSVIINWESTAANSYHIRHIFEAA